MKTALITGITGMDGSHLAELLLSKGYKVYGIVRRHSGSKEYSRIEHIKNKITLLSGDLTDYNSLVSIMKTVKPTEIYNLGAMSFVPDSFIQPILTANITGLGVLNMLEAMRQVCPKARFYQASTSELFGKVQETPQSEKTKFHPRSPYGVSKLFAHWTTINYRESYGLFACCGILYNHEGERRGMEFVSRKITDGIARIKYDLQEFLEMGNLSAERDWGYAPDYVKAMWLMLQQEKPDDYVIATGKKHSVRDFIELAFKYAGTAIAWRGHGLDEVGIDKATKKIVVKVNKNFFRPAETQTLLGDARKALKELGWKPETSFEELTKKMIIYDCDRIRKLVAAGPQ